MSDKLPADLAALIEAERRAPGSPPGARARVHERLMVTLGGGGGGGGAAGGAAAGKLILGKWLIATLTAVVIATATYLVVAPRSPLVFPDPRPPLSAPTPPVPVPVPVPDPAAPPPPPPPPPRRSTLAAERALLDSALSALRAGDPAAALARTAEHARRFPRGELAEEREVLAIRALVKASDGDAARARAARFRARFPDSIQLEVIDAALGTLP